MLQKIASGISAFLISIASLFSLQPVLDTQPYIEQIRILRTKIENIEKPVLGADNFNFVGGRPYKLAGSGVTASASSLNLTFLNVLQANSVKKVINMSDLGSVACGTIEPEIESKKEFVSFTGITQNSDGTAALTGLSRGLLPFAPYTASTTYQQAHAGGSTFILSNAPCLYNNLVAKDNDETILGLYQFTTIPWSDGTATTTNQFSTRAYANSLAIANQVPAATNTIGFVEIAAPWDVASSTWAGNSTTTVDARNALHAGLVNIGVYDNGIDRFATSSIVGTDVGYGGRVNPNLIATSTNSIYRWNSNHLFNASNTISGVATTTFVGNSLNVTSPASSTPGWYAQSTGSANTYNVLLEPNPSAYLWGMQVNFKVSASNTAASTLNVNGLGTKAIVNRNGVDLVLNDLIPSTVYTAIYDGTNFKLQNPSVSQVQISTSSLATGTCSASGGNTFNTIDASSVIGSRSAVLFVKIEATAGTVADYNLRKNGETTVFSSTTLSTANTPIYAQVPTDGTGKFQFRCGVSGGQATITLEGFWIQ